MSFPMARRCVCGSSKRAIVGIHARSFDKTGIRKSSCCQTIFWIVTNLLDLSAARILMGYLVGKNIQGKHDETVSATHFLNRYGNVIFVLVDICIHHYKMVTGFGRQRKESTEEKEVARHKMTCLWTVDLIFKISASGSRRWCQLKNAMNYLYIIALRVGKHYSEAVCESSDRHLFWNTMNLHVVIEPQGKQSPFSNSHVALRPGPQKQLANEIIHEMPYRFIFCSKGFNQELSCFFLGRNDSGYS